MVCLLSFLSYLLGAVPFGLILVKYAGLGDVRKIGSGNIGATNVLRTGNKRLALATLSLDIAKGAIAVYIAKFTGMYFVVILSGVAVVLGHIFPVWLKLKGGKGVATALAVYWVIYWPMGLFASIAWLFVFYVGRFSSLASVSAMALSPVIAMAFAGTPMFFLSVIIGSVVIYRHKDNMVRLMRGKEHSFDDKK